MSVTVDIKTRIASSTDAEALTRIYNHYIRESVITFEEIEVSPQEMASRVAKITELSLPWLVAESEGVVVGYAYASKWKERSAYRFSVETTVYLDPNNTGQGIGSRLYRDLLTSLRGKSVHAVIGGIAQPNEASVALHERLGFTKVAHFKEVGFKFGRWVDVGYWQISL
ncbi:MAG TPA: arsinothricin resistance N-acetyltransferase ArsN1 family B [Steroidobacteraceae bacterium]|nr:arsinothricin resistance N-acetyltransferase ArsN1 family B [Steroidobacteraceae bacterium]